MPEEHNEVVPKAVHMYSWVSICATPESTALKVLFVVREKAMGPEKISRDTVAASPQGLTPKNTQGL